MLYHSGFWRSCGGVGGADVQQRVGGVVTPPGCGGMSINGGGVSAGGSGPFCSVAIIPVMICQVFVRDEEMANRFVELPSRVHLLIILARRDESNPSPPPR